MPQIPKETQQAIEKQARSILNKYGEGSIYQKPGKKDQLQFLYDDETGTKRRKALSIPEGADPQQVKLEFIIKTLTNRYQLQQEQKKRQLLQETISQDFLEKVDKIVEALPETKKTLNPCTKTVNQVLDEYLQECKNRNLTDGTTIVNEYIFSRISQFFGKKKIKDITNEDFQSLLYNIKRADTNELLSKSYVKNVRNLFIQVLKYAKRQKYISSYLDIIEDVKLPENLKTPKDSDLFLDYKDLAKILYTVRNNLQYYTIITVLSLTGLRSQELFGLRKQDIDHKNHRIYIGQALKRQIRTSSGMRGLKIGLPKNSASIRYVPALDSVLILLDRWIVYRENEGIQKQADKKGNGDLVFTNKNGELIDINPLLNGLQIYLDHNKVCDIKHFTFHMCRRFYATYLYRQECNLQVIQQCMGHTTKKGSVTETHYIAPDPSYLEKALPYLREVEQKLIEACKEVENEYSNTPNE